MMLLFEEPASRLRNRDKLGKWGLEPWVATAENAPLQGENLTGGDANCQICASAGDLLCRMIGAGGQLVGQKGGFSLESEHDLALMVRDFLENDSAGSDSVCSSDSDSGFLDLAHLAEKISFHKHNVGRYESDLSSMVNSLLLSLNEKDLHHVKAGPCNASCIRQSLVKLLRSSGYDAAVCISKWQGFGKVPGGDHEYIDVVPSGGMGSSERLIIDIDFHSHFDIARAVESYDVVLNSLPVVYVGSLVKLKQLLPIMVEAARISLKYNSMPLPPWRSLAYLQAKWQSTYQRKPVPDGRERNDVGSSYQKQCIGHLRALRGSLQSEIETERLLKSLHIQPIVKKNSRRVKCDRWRNRNRKAVEAYHQR